MYNVSNTSLKLYRLLLEKLPGELMIRSFKMLSYMLIACFIVILAGCSELEPQTGTKITFGFSTDKPVKRSKIAELSRYLILRADDVLNIRKARIEKVTDSSIILLLPGKKISQKEAGKLLERSSIEFYHLKNLKTKNNSEKKWSIRIRDEGGYIFSGPDALRIDSRTDRDDLLKDIVGYPDAEPVLAGQDIRPISTYQEISKGWAVLVHFTKSGTDKFYQFTKDNPGEYIGLFYNGSLISVAVIDKPIKDGVVFLPGFGTANDAEAAVMQLNLGHIPVPVKLISVEYY